MLPLRLFRVRAFTAANLTGFCTSGAIFSAAFLTAQYFQLGLGYSPLVTAVFAANGHLGSAATFTAGYRPAMAVSAGISLLGAVAAVAVGRKRPVPAAAAPASVPVSAAKPRGAGDVPAAMNSGVVAP
jgi:hypothetical protein